MKRIATWLNENQYRTYKAKAEKMGTTVYKLTKSLILEYLEEIEKQRVKFLTIVYYFIIYSLVVTALVLLR